jgi:hypothetical protein
MDETGGKIHIVTARLGNTPKFAMKHYLMVTERDFERAANCGAAVERSGAQANENTAGPSDESEEFAVSCASLRPSEQFFSGEDRIRFGNPPNRRRYSLLRH